MSRQTIIETAASQNGTKEFPPNSNKTKYGEWYGLNGVKWCAIFVSWVYDHAGNPLCFIETAKGYQSCQGGYNFWKTAGQLTNEPQPGDIVLFDWDGDGLCDHTGIFDSWIDFTKTGFFSWEGNTSVSSNSDGGMVMRRERNRSLVRAFASPAVLEYPSQPVINDNMKNGDSGAKVANLQRLLHNIGYHLTVNGIFENETEAVIKKFQNDHSLMITGEVTPALLGAIQEQAAQPNVPTKKFTTGTYLRKGNTGAGVLSLQMALNVAGANPKVTEGGVFGSSTVTALKAFQQKNNLTVDGIAGPETFEVLGLKV